jgi:hypothetical protein
MTISLVESDIAAMAVVLACCLKVLQRFTSGQWKRRFGAMGSPLIEQPGYRVLFLLVIGGVLLISVVPEAALMVSAVDAVGLDIVTILAALELRHYFTSVARIAGIPTSVAACRRIAAQLVRSCRNVIRTKPVLWLYACMWPVIWIRTLMGTIRLSPPAPV